MTHRERVLKTFRFEQTDRTAYDLMEGTVWPELLAHFRDRYSLHGAAEVLEFVDTDLRWTGMVEHPPSGEHSAQQSAPSDAALTKQVTRGPLAGAQTVAEVESHDWPDPARWQPPDFAQARYMWPRHALVFAAGWSPLFWGTCEAFGVEVALLNLLSTPALFECAVRSIHERYMDRLGRGLAAAQGFCDICWLGDDIASQQSILLSPEHWRRFIKPYLAEQVALARGHGMYVLYHSCGAVRPVLADLIEIGIDGLLVFQTSANGMDAESIATEFGGRMVFYGGIDVQRLLSFGTTRDVLAEVQANVRAFADCGGYIVANSHHCVATIKGENIEAMCRAARNSAR
jgi:uroporphyrinogen decarboxylase